VVGYNLKKGSFPGSLAELTERDPNDGSPAYLEADAILDPWHNVFIYEPGSLSKSGKPRIYSNGDPGHPKTIANWYQ